jgi:hypothetical protein
MELMNYCRFQKIGKKIIKETEKERDTERHADHDARKPRRFLPRGPIHMTDLNP